MENPETYTLQLGGKVDFLLPVPEVSFMSFYSSSYDPTPNPSLSFDNTQFDIFNHQGDVLLVISIRRVNGTIVFNSRRASGDWGPEEIIPLEGLFHHTDATISVKVDLENFIIFVDGAQVYVYKRRFNEGVTGAAYYGPTEAGGSVFGDNPISVTIQRVSGD